jgi:hypothetical protein
MGNIAPIIFTVIDASAVNLRVHFQLPLRLAETGESANGLVAIHRAVEMYESLARESFATHGCRPCTFSQTPGEAIAKVSDSPERHGGSLLEHALDLAQTNATRGVALCVKEEFMQRVRQKLRADDDGDQASRLCATSHG